MIALDLRNHGASPHAAAMDYPAMAADVLETLAARDALPAVLIGHSMGGKAAMRAALIAPDAVTALLVADIAPVPYPPHFAAIAAAMAAMPLRRRPDPRRGRRGAGGRGAGCRRCGRSCCRTCQRRGGRRPQWRIGLTRSSPRCR